MSSIDPRSLLSEVRLIVNAANRESRDMTEMECERCVLLLDAAEALSRLRKAQRPETSQSPSK